MKKNNSNFDKKAISLITLLITIAILIILSTTSVILVINSGIFDRTDELKFKNDISKYSDEVKNRFVSITDASYNGDIISGEALLEYIPGASDSEYLDSMYISNGKLVLNSTNLDDNMIKWAKEVGIDIVDVVTITGLDITTTYNSIEITGIKTVGQASKIAYYSYSIDGAIWTQDSPLSIKKYEGLDQNTLYDSKRSIK